MASGVRFSALLRRLRLATAAIVCLTGVASQSLAVTIDFEALAPSLGGSTEILVPSPFVEDGFAVATSVGVPSLEGFAAYGTAEVGRYTGTAALHNAICCSNTVLTLSTQSGALFRLISIDLSELFQGNDSPLALTFVGTRQGGGTVTQVINVDVSPFHPTMSTYAFGPDFSDLVSVRWDMGAVFHQFDNIVVATPTP